MAGMANVVSMLFLSAPSARRATGLCRGRRLGFQFLSTPSARRATRAAVHAFHRCVFLSTPSARRATRSSSKACALPTYFYPRPPRGGRPVFRLLWLYHSIFLSTPSARRATRPAAALRPPAGFLSTPSARRATTTGWCDWQNSTNFYPRPPRGGRHLTAVHAGSPAYFYPRPPRGGRLGPQLLSGHLPDFYPRPPRGGRRLPAGATGKIRRISIHALREEGDGAALPSAECLEDISIHALREEGDARMLAIGGRIAYFYPRPPRGGRRDGIVPGDITVKFLSTPSARRATFAPLILRRLRDDFYPRPPRGGRHLKKKRGDNPYFISIHALREEGDMLFLL